MQKISMITVPSARPVEVQATLNFAMVPDLTKNQIVVWVPPSTLEIGDLLRSGTFSQLSGTSQVTGGPRSQQVPEFKSSTCTSSDPLDTGHRQSTTVPTGMPSATTVIFRAPRTDGQRNGGHGAVG